MPEAQLTRLFWEALDRLAYAVMDARLSLFDLMHGPEPPTPADDTRGTDRERLQKGIRGNRHQLLVVILHGRSAGGTSEAGLTFEEGPC